MGLATSWGKKASVGEPEQLVWFGVHAGGWSRCSRFTYACTRQQTGSSGNVIHIRVHLMKRDLSCITSGNEMGKRLQLSNSVVDSFHVATTWHCMPKTPFPPHMHICSHHTFFDLLVLLSVSVKFSYTFTLIHLCISVTMHTCAVE